MTSRVVSDYDNVTLLPVKLKTISAVEKIAPWLMWLVMKLLSVVLTVTLMKLTDSI